MRSNTPTPELAAKNEQAIKCTAPDGTECHLAPVPLYGCDSTVWLEWQDRMDHPQEIRLYDGVYNRVRDYDAEIVPYEETRFGSPPT